jgi:2-methylisocitrate lyase-like PEP mutase family enzyme
VRTQAEKARAFRALHARPGLFIMPNPWDAGTARLFAALGFEALATTSLGLASSLGKVDGTLSVTRVELIGNCRAIAAATDLPVNADLENGYSDDPQEAATIMRLAADAGIVGGSMEDATGNAAKPIYDFDLAVERVAACARVVKKLPFPFTLTARAENFLHGRRDLDDTIRRLKAYGEAGADVLYAPGLWDVETIRKLVSALDKPVNVVIGQVDPAVKIRELAAAGVKRISVGGALSRLAFARVREAAIELRDAGSLEWLRQTMPGKDLKDIFGRKG